MRAAAAGLLPLSKYRSEASGLIEWHQASSSGMAVGADLALHGVELLATTPAAAAGSSGAAATPATAGAEAAEGGVRSAGAAAAAPAAATTAPAASAAMAAFPVRWMEVAELPVPCSIRSGAAVVEWPKWDDALVMAQFKALLLRWAELGKALGAAGLPAVPREDSRMCRDYVLFEKFPLDQVGAGGGGVAAC
jgi:hypothetical protein